MKLDREEQHLIASIATMLVVIMTIGFFMKPRPVMPAPDVIEATNMISYSYDKHTEVTYINEVHAHVLDSLGIDSIRDDDWVETANALGVDVEDLSITMFMDHLKTSVYEGQ